MSFEILVTAPRLEAEGLALLEEAGCAITLVPAEGGRAEMERLLATHRFDGVLSRFLPITGAAMASCPTLRVISRAAAGYDAVDLPAATTLGIPVLTAAGANAQSVAEFTIGLILSAARNIPSLDRSTHAGGWDRSRLGLELHGRRLGLVGYGQIARKVARIAEAIGMRVSAWSPRLHLAGDIAPATRASSLHALLGHSDVVSLHAPLNDASRGLIGAAELELMGDAILVNTGRGELVDEAALAAALRAGRLRAAALDVRATEPPPAGDPLAGLPNLIVSPHFAAGPAASRGATARMAARHLLDALLGQPMPPGVCVNPEVLQAAAGTSR